MILHRGSRKAVRLFSHATRTVFEPLEERKLLTTIHGGDIFEYTDGTAAVNPTAALDRVHAFGSASDQYELIGSSFTNGGFVLGDVPGLITHPDGSTTEVLGGVGGRHGISLIGTATGANESLTDLVNPNQNTVGSPAFGLPGAFAPSGGITIDAMSSNSKGTTWGFNVIQQQAGGATVKRVELVNINYTNTTDPARRITPADAIITADIAPQIVALTGAADTTAINDIIACDFLPSNDNLLYFAVSVNVLRGSAVNPTQAPASVPITFLLRYNFAAANPAQAVEPVNLNQPGNSTEFISDQAQRRLWRCCAERSGIQLYQQ